MDQYFKIQLRLIFIFLFISLTVISFSQVRYIEGLHYLDNTPVSVGIDNGKIVGIQRLERLSDENHSVYIAPGLIDNQVNGFCGISFRFEDNLGQEEVRKVTRELWKRGVTSYLATLITNTRDVLYRNFSILAKARNDQALLGSMAGFHLEGPYISGEAGYRGSHFPKYIRNPDWEEFMDFYKVSGAAIVTVTIAPELKGAMDFIRGCSSMGIIVAIGHHNANKAIVDQAVLNGAQITTHLGNGCANLINRHENPLWPQLANTQLMASIICDGIHLRDEEIATFYNVKGPELTIVTSDVTEFGGMPPGIYKRGDGTEIEITETGMARCLQQDVLAGSTFTMDKGVRHVMKVTGCTLGEAIKMASTNPAKLYRLNDRGEIRPGMRADLIVFTIGKEKLEIEQTYVAGELVYQAKR